MKCLVIVAHPDDETIWMGGLMLRHPDWAWRIIALSRCDDPDRAPKFGMAARVYGAASAMSDLDDSPILESLSQDLHEIKNRIREHGFGFQVSGSRTQTLESKLQGTCSKSGTRHPIPDTRRLESDTRNQYDLVFTHGVHGEYERHIRHEQVHRAVEEMSASGELQGDCVFFAYADANPIHAPDVSITLHANEYAAKQRVMREIYGFTDGQFETQAAGWIEAFRFGSGNVGNLKSLIESDGRTK